MGGNGLELGVELEGLSNPFVDKTANKKERGCNNSQHFAAGMARLIVCNYSALIEKQLYKLPLGVFFDNTTTLVCVKANKA